MSSIRSTLRRAGAFAAAAAFAAACAFGAASVRAADQKPIVIGAAVSLTGAYADGGKYTLQGYELWVKQQNAHGGLLGRKLELKTYDDQSDASVGIRLYEKLVNEDHVDLLAGPYGSALTAPTSNVAARYKMVMFCPEDAAPVTFDRGNRYIFQGLPQAVHYVDGVMAMAKARALKTVALVGEDTPFPHAIGSAVPELAKSDGMTVVLTEYYPHNTSDFSALVQKIKAANPDVLLAASFVPDSIALLRQLKQADVAPKMVYEAIGGSDPAFGPAAGKDADGVLSSTAWSADLKTPGNGEFVKSFTAEYGRAPDYHSASSFAGLTVLAEAVKRAGGLDQEKIREQLASMKMETLFGQYSVDPSGKQVGYQAYAQQWQGGRQVIVYPESHAQGKLKFPFASWRGR
ncbi:MAG TPA: amino acid ABC transporter substrate-binding protein [Candidatus Baltobacteraceae bacterium]|nr:amino acid ABC transporter substrate-binding protein [Candidatus Baltobacteraceae bacterium]